MNGFRKRHDHYLAPTVSGFQGREPTFPPMFEPFHEAFIT